MIPDVYPIWRERVSAAALQFENRWTVLALTRVDANLAQRLTEQRDLFHKVCVTGRPGEIVRHGEAMVRGYALAVHAMEQAGTPDDAYLVGRCPRTGTVVAIGEQKAALDRVRELHGPYAVLVTPDEVAALFGSIEALKTLAVIKRRFPGAEITETRETEQNP